MSCAMPGHAGKTSLFLALHFFPCNTLRIHDFAASCGPKRTRYACVLHRPNGGVLSALVTAIGTRIWRERHLDLLLMRNLCQQLTKVSLQLQPHARSV